MLHLEFQKNLIEGQSKIKKFQAYLKFETHGAITISQIVEGQNLKYQKCVKAITDNAQKEFFDQDFGGQKFGGVELAAVYKIDHNPALGKFERKMRQVESTHILKGLFIPIKKADFMAISVFGFTSEPMTAQ